MIQVHSLCTVISMKMEVPEAAWVNDLDGFVLADSINSHLSPLIRIFGIVPVTRCWEYFNTVTLELMLHVCSPFSCCIFLLLLLLYSSEIFLLIFLVVARFREA